MSTRKQILRESLFNFEFYTQLGYLQASKKNKDTS